MKKTALRLLGALPLGAAHALGTALGCLLYWIPNRRRHTARVNLALCFPELPGRERERLLRRNLIEAGKTVAEASVLWHCDAARFRRLAPHAEGENELHRAFAQKKGVILAIPHLGAWEAVGLYCSLRYPMVSLYGALADRNAEHMVKHARERFGARLVAADNAGIRALYRALTQGETVAILPDQVPAAGSGSVTAPFFGVPVNTMALLSRLAIKTGAPTFGAYAERLSFGRGYRLHFVAGAEAIRRGSIEESATAVNALVEQCARAIPTQYQWIYKRFRGTTPEARARYRD